MGIKYKAIMCSGVAGKFVERFAETLVSSVSELSIRVDGERVIIALEATTYLGEEVLKDALSKPGELSRWGYHNRFRVPLNVGGILVEG